MQYPGLAALALSLVACGSDASSSRTAESSRGSSAAREIAKAGNGNGSGNGNRTGMGSASGDDRDADEPIDAAKLSVIVRVRGGDVIVTGDKLLAVPRVAPPGEVEGGTGWRVSTILGLAGVHDAKRVVLANATGASLAFDNAFGDLDERGAVPYLKLNRQGQLRFRMYRKVGEGWQSGETLRDVTRIDVQ